jgi:hypothetical protein
MRITTAYAIAWLATSLAISVGIVVTESLVGLWFFLIPALINLKEGE